MKKILTIALFASGLISTMAVKAQATEEKSKRPSPPAMVTQKINSGATISIDYSQPSVNGRTIGKDLEPMDGQVWRTGANEATVFSTDKDIMVEGKALPAGKYGLFTLFNGDDVTVIFNKTSKQWGAFKYKEADDALRVKGTQSKLSSPTEKMTFAISEDGKVDLMWGDRKVEFTVQ
ncbi:MAG: DUF2911 domain-containing protein [Ginsengibacter sp.]